MSARLESVAAACPFCGSCEVSGSIEGTERLFERGGSYEYKACADCGSFYLYDRSIDLGEHYPEDYYSYTGARRPFVQATWEDFVCRMRARFVLRLARGAGTRVDASSQIVDVGCGAGDLLRAFRSIGYGNVLGIDPFLREETDTAGIPVERRTIGELAQDAKVVGKATIVMFHHSLEHVFDPGENLIAARALLKPGGSIVVRVPVINYAYERYGTCWVGFDAPRHVAIPTERSMEAVAERTHLRVARVCYDSNETQFVVSESYVRGISPRRAFPSNPPRTAVRKFLTLPKLLHALWLNARKQGDQAAFVLKDAVGNSPS